MIRSKEGSLVRRNKEGWFDFQELRPLHNEIVDFTYTMGGKSFASMAMYDSRKGFLRSILNGSPRVFEPKLWKEHKCQDHCMCKVRLAYDRMDTQELSMVIETMKAKMSMQIIKGGSELRSIQGNMGKFPDLFESYSKSMKYLQGVLGHMRSLTTSKDILEDIMEFLYPGYNNQNVNNFNHEYEKVNTILEMVSKEV